MAPVGVAGAGGAVMSVDLIFNSFVEGEGAAIGSQRGPDAH